MTEQVATNVTWQDGEVSRVDRFSILRQRGVTIWFTGLSGSGKSTIAVALEGALYKMGKLSYRLDGDIGCYLFDVIQNCTDLLTNGFIDKTENEL